MRCLAYTEKTTMNQLNLEMQQKISEKTKNKYTGYPRHNACPL